MNTYFGSCNTTPTKCFPLYKSIFFYYRRFANIFQKNIYSKHHKIIFSEKLFHTHKTNSSVVTQTHSMGAIFKGQFYLYNFCLDFFSALTVFFKEKTFWELASCCRWCYSVWLGKNYTIHICGRTSLIIITSYWCDDDHLEDY